MKFEAADIHHYYESNTDAFLRFGEGGQLGAIRRAVRKEPDASAADGFHYVDAQLLRHLGSVGRVDSRAPRFLDLGCGVGASLEYLLQRSPGRGFGTSLSDSQIRYAKERLSRFGDRVQLSVADFCRAPLPADMDLAYGIESFVQAPDSAAFFSQAQSSLRVGGRLALCDDFLAPSLEPAASDWVDEFRAGWRLSSLMTPAHADRLAETSGFALVEDVDWTPYLELDRARDKMIHGMVAVLRPLRWNWSHPRWGNYLGGNALRQCLKRGWVHYRFRVWERVT